MFRRGLLAMLMLGTAGGASAADLDVEPPPVAVATGSRWQGVSFGGYLSETWSTGQDVTQNWYAPYAGFASTLPLGFTTGGSGFGAGLQLGYDKQYGSLVGGIMADYGYIESDKSTRGFAGTLTWPNPQSPALNFSNVPITETYTQQLQTLGTVRGRLGLAIDNDWLIYGDVGLAYGQTLINSTLTTSTTFGGSGSSNGFAMGYALGGGVQYAVDTNWSIGLDGLYYNLGDRDNVAVPTYYYTTKTGAVTASPETSTRSEFSGFQLRLTAMYQFDGPPEAQISRPLDPNATVPITIGVRTGFSTGQTQMTLYDGTGSTKLSRLTYKNADTITTEPYFNIEVPNAGLFITGFMGLGSQRNGNLQDEDFLDASLGGYSSTNSGLQDGSLEYGVLDVGYDGFHAQNFSFGGFIGGAFENDGYNAVGCTQTASNPEICPAGSGIASNTLTITDQFSWRAARIGLNASVNFGQAFTISADAAWLPYISVSDRDNHWLRMPGDFFAAIPGSGTSSMGYQLQAKADMRITPGFDIGAGIRYWYMQAKGDQNFQDAATTGGPQVAQWTSSRLQAFVETGYHF